MTQTRLINRRSSKYQYGPINQVIEGKVQKIKTFEGCPHNCPYCDEPTGRKYFEIPELVCDKILEVSQNILYREDAKQYLIELGMTGREVELVCGVDFRLLDMETAEILREFKFGWFNKKWKWSRGIRIAWDWFVDDQYKIIDAIKLLLGAGFNQSEIMVFMIVNWKVPLWECELKLDLLKVWGVKVCDCCFDGGHANAIPEYWSQKEIDYFRAKCALHNQLVNYKIYPDLQRAKRMSRK